MAAVLPVLWLAALPARAQEGPAPLDGEQPTAPAPGAQDVAPTPVGDTAGPASEVMPPAPEIFEPWAGDHRWQELSVGRPTVSVVVSRTGRLMAMGPDGAVLRSEDGRTWRVVLAPDPAASEEFDEEALLLDAESAIDDLVDLESAADDDFVSDEDALQLDSDVLNLASEVGEVGSDIAVLDATDRVADGSEGLPGRLWIHPSRPGLILAGRPDGLWRSQDMGRSWDRMAGPRSARAFLHSDEFGLLVGGRDGLWRSDDDGRSFQPVSLAPDDINALVALDGVVLAGSSAGLLLSGDGERFAVLPSLGDRVIYDILPDPAVEAGLWLATDDGILRSDDLGQSVFTAGRNPLVGTIRLVGLERPGALLAVGTAGVWESVDGGVTWDPVANQLPSPDAFDLVLDDRGPLVAGAFGLFRLARGVQVEDRAEPEEEARGIVLPGLDEVVGRALSRPGLSMRELSVGRRALAARLSPVLNLRLRHDNKLNRRTSYRDQFTTESEDHNWVGEVRLCWGRCGSNTDVLIDVDTDVGAASDLVELGVLGSEVYDFSADDAVPAAAANVAARAVSYRTAVADMVSKAWFARRALEEEQARVASLPLAQQIDHHLRVQETDARLDLYTDGWYSLALAADRRVD